MLIVSYSMRTSNIHAAAAKSLQSCPTLCDPIDGSPPGSAVPGILQARTLECVAKGNLRIGDTRAALVSPLAFCSSLNVMYC